jgi:hypothetical protein
MKASMESFDKSANNLANTGNTAFKTDKVWRRAAKGRFRHSPQSAAVQNLTQLLRRIAGVFAVLANWTNAGSNGAGGGNPVKGRPKRIGGPLRR